jgi:hypothetical protein
MTLGIGAHLEREVDGLLEPALELGMRTRTLQASGSAGAGFGFDELGRFAAEPTFAGSVLVHVLELPPEIVTGQSMLWRNERAVYLRGGARLSGVVDTFAPWLGIGLSKGCVYGELGWALQLDGDEARHQLLAVVGVSLNPFCYSSPP